MKNVALSFAFLVSTLSAFAAGPGGDTVVVKMKNKNKVILITEKNKDLKSLKDLNMENIMIQIDSSLSQMNMDSMIQMKVEKDMGDMIMIEKGDDGEKKIVVTKRIEKGAGGEKKMVVSKRLQVEDVEDDGDDKDDDKTFMVVQNGDTIIKRVIRKQIVKGPKVDFFKQDFDTEIFELDFGFNNYLQNGKFPGDDNQKYGLSPFNSNIVNLRFMERVLGKAGKTRLSASVGLEFSWNNYKFSENVVIGKDSASVTFDPFAASQKKIKSKLTVSWINVPFMVHYNSKKSSFHMALGGFAGYRLGSHSKTKFTDDGVTKKEKEFTNFYLNSLQYGLRFQFGFYDVDFFAAYNLNSLFSSGRGPALTPISFGITL
jgi:hypothetical protein